jgi:hypothetical protein
VLRRQLESVADGPRPVTRRRLATIGATSASTPVHEGRSARRHVCEHAFVTWQRLVLALVVYALFLIGTQWLFLDGISTITTIVFTAFFLVVMRPWTPNRLHRPLCAARPCAHAAMGSRPIGCV